MPIRFRCPFCNQLLGIARRKAGTEIRCPTCQGFVQVPTQEAPEILLEPTMPTPAPVPAPAPQRPALFERDDFDVLLRGSILENPRQRTQPRATAAAAARPVPPPPPIAAVPMVATAAAAAGSAAVPSPGWNVEPVTLSPRPADGIVLTSTQVTVLTVVLIVLLAIAFAVGLLVGRFLL